VKRVLRAYATLQRDGAKLAAPRKAVADFTPEGVCLEGSIQEFLARCHQVDSLMRGEKPVPAGVGTMLFYGPPGTGKTALARYVAKELKRECLVKRASDLRSCWVGQTEKLIARAFETAEDEGSVLVIDEADSFIYSRDIATHSWETSQVNEFLTALEECRSFCICTTNRRENLDSAAMRRFSHKVAFDYAKPAQILALYGKLLAPLAPGTLTAALEKELLAMDSLTPGDFHAVQARYGSALAGETAVDQAALVAALGREQSLKVDRRERHIGF
jgi:SpoVK/Ycf46/Vps4 family AAA+-type ATPase